MNNIIRILNQDGQLVVTSRQIAEDFEKEHKDVLEKIRTLVAENSAVKNMLIESSFENRGKQYPEYLLTRDGFSLLVMGFTGAKALEWKLKYIEAFNKMEQALKEQKIDTSQLSAETQLLLKLSQSIAKQELANKEIVQAVKETKEEVQAIRDVVEIRPSDNWRAETNKLVKKICYKLQDYSKPKEDVYKALQERGSCDLKIRLKNMRGRLALEGVTKTKLDNLNYLDVIAADKKLIEIYTAIVKEMAIKYKVA